MHKYILREKNIILHGTFKQLFIQVCNSQSALKDKSAVPSPIRRYLLVCECPAETLTKKKTLINLSRQPKCRDGWNLYCG